MWQIKFVKLFERIQDTQPYIHIYENIHITYIYKKKQTVKKRKIQIHYNREVKKSKSQLSENI